jgi:hypothetical protein
MYWIVPITIPALVSGDNGVASLIVFAADNNGALADEPSPGAAGFASPKSINFAPFLVSMMFAGFKSR